MPGSPQSIPPSWNESDSFRETTLQLFDDPTDREAVRHMGRVLYDLAVETSRDKARQAQIQEADSASLESLAAREHGG